MTFSTSGDFSGMGGCAIWTAGATGAATRAAPCPMYPRCLRACPTWAAEEASMIDLKDISRIYQIGSEKVYALNKANLHSIPANLSALSAPPAPASPR